MSSQASASLLPDEEASPPKGHGLQDVSGPGAFKKRAAESSVGPVFYSRLLRLFAIGFPSWTARSTVWTYGVCLVSILVPTVLGALVSTIIEPLQNAVIRAEYAEAMLQLSWISAALVICALLYTFQAYAGERIRLGWRQAIVTRIHRAYFRARLVYAANILDARIDNFDQRVSEDVEDMTIAVWTLVFGSFKVYAGFIYTVVNGIVVFVYLDTMWIGYAVPFALSLFSVVFTTVLMIPIARRSYLQQGYEGSFRFGHSRVKEFAECVAFYAGQKKEHRLAEGRFNDVYVNNAKLLRRQFALNLFNGIFVQLMSIAMVLSVMYIQTHSPKDECGNDTLQGHPVNVGSVQQLFIKMTTAAGLLAVLVRLYGSLGVAAGYVHRIGELFETFDEWERVFARFESERRIQYTNEHAEPKVEAHKISLALPSGGPLLLHNVSFTVEAGKSLIIMGPSGSGKSSLLRVLAGLWPFNNGHLVRPRGVGRGGVFFLPQRPYTVLGSLRDQIAFPHSVHPSDEVLEQYREAGLLPDDEAGVVHSKPCCSTLRSFVTGSDVAMQQRAATEEATQEPLLPDHGIESLLHELGLGHLQEMGGLDHVASWDDMLSGGEVQRLGFVRLFYHRPRFAIMDESTSALDVGLEATCMEKCKELGITCISVAHRPTLLRHHDNILELDGKGRCELREIGAADYERFGVSSDGVGDVAMHSIGQDAAAEPAGPGEQSSPPRSTSARGRSTPLRKGQRGQAGAEASASHLGLEQLLESRSKNEVSYGLDARFRRRFADIWKIMVPSWCSQTGGLLLATLFLATVSGLGASLLTGVITPLLFAALADAASARVLSLCFVMLVGTIIAAFCSSGLTYLGGIFLLTARRNLVRYLHALYFQHNVIFAANRLQEDLDNIDQRICGDVRSLTDTLSGVLFATEGLSYGVVSVIPTIVFSSAMLLLIKNGWFIVLLCVGYNVGIVAITKVLANPMARWTAAKERREGDFRFLHARIREFSESVSLFSAESKEKRVADYIFDSLYFTYQQLLSVTFRPTFVARFQDFASALLPFIFTAIMLFTFPDSISPYTGGASTPANASNVARPSLSMGIADLGLLFGPQDHWVGHEHTAHSASAWQVAPGNADSAAWGASAAGLASGGGSGSGPKCGDSAQGKKTKSKRQAQVLAILFSTQLLMQQLKVLPSFLTYIATIAGLVHRLARLIDVLREWSDVYYKFESHAVDIEVEGEELVSLPMEAQTTSTRGVRGGRNISIIRMRRIVSASYVCAMHVTCCTPKPIDEQDDNEYEGEEGEAQALSVAESLLHGGSVLLRDLSLRVKSGESLIITGPSGSGKSSLLRVLGGLWPFPEGAILRPHQVGRDGVFFVPQRPYLTQGTLRDQIIYPDDDQALADDELIEILRFLDLTHLLDRGMKPISVNVEDSNPIGRRFRFANTLRHRFGWKKHGPGQGDAGALDPDTDVLHDTHTTRRSGWEPLDDDTEHDTSDVADASGRASLAAADLWERQARMLDAEADWENMLSGGEMQRLGFARLFYHRPRFAIMDESTSALDTALEASCMRKCNELNITCISVAHRPSLLQFHKNMLQLDSQGGFRMVKDVQGGATAQR